MRAARSDRGRARRLRAKRSRARAARRSARRGASRRARLTILRLCAEEGRRLAGETLPFDSRAGFRKPRRLLLPFSRRRRRGDHTVQRSARDGRRTRSGRRSPPATPSCSEAGVARRRCRRCRFARDLAAAGLPAGRLNIITGPGEELGTGARVDCARPPGHVHGRGRDGRAHHPRRRPQEDFDGARRRTRRSL